MPLSAGPMLMGILNVTPDSFSDGGALSTPEGRIDPQRVLQQARRLVEQGASILDLGAEATSFHRPGIEPIDAQEQLARLIPSLELIADAELSGPTGRVILSVDTRSSLVARAALEAGANWINDVSAGGDPEMFPTVAGAGAPIILMHSVRHCGQEALPENPVLMRQGLVAMVVQELKQRALAAQAAGAERVLLDPGIGFGKTAAENWQLIAHIGELVALGFPVVLGISRKRFLQLETTTLPAVDWLEKDFGTAMVTTLAAARGVQIHRVHNVGLSHRALELAHRAGEDFCFHAFPAARTN